MNRSTGNTGLPEVFMETPSRGVNDGKANLISLQMQTFDLHGQLYWSSTCKTKKKPRKVKLVHQPGSISKNGTTFLSIVPAKEPSSVNYLPPTGCLSQDSNIIYDIRSKYVLGKTGSLPG